VIVSGLVRQRDSKPDCHEDSSAGNRRYPGALGDTDNPPFRFFHERVVEIFFFALYKARPRARFLFPRVVDGVIVRSESTERGQNPNP